MGTVTVFTAAHMKAIEDATVTSMSVNGSGHLIVTRHDGSTFDAGDVSTWLPGRLQAANNLGAGVDPDGLVDSGWYSASSWISTLAGYAFGAIEVLKYDATHIVQNFWTIEAIPRRFNRAKFGASWTTWSQKDILATSAESITGTAIDRAVTPKALTDTLLDPSRKATSTAQGPIQLATSAESITGIDPNKALTPLTVTARINDQFRYGTVQPWSTGLAPVLLDDGVTTVNCYFSPTNPDVITGAPVRVERLGSGIWIITEAYSATPTFPKWIDLALTTGWTYRSIMTPGIGLGNNLLSNAPYHKPQYVKTAGNYVELAGCINFGAGAGTTVATLPVGFRPLVEQMFTVVQSAGGTSFGTIGVIMQTNGDIVLQGTPTAGTYLFLDGIGFTVDSLLTWTSLATVGYLNSWADVGGTDPIGAIAVDSNYRVFVRGKIKRTTGTAGANNLTNAVPTQFRVDSVSAGTQAIIGLQIDPGVALRRVDFQVGGTFYDPGGGFTDTKLDMSRQWLSKDFPSSRWYQPTYYSGGADYGTGYPARGFAKTDDGMVQFKGLCNNTVGGKTMESLPPGYRPAGTRWFVINSGNTAGSILVFPSGDVYWVNGSAFEELNAIRFVAEQ